ncbi:MAG TPA: UDP-N-acetylglucosamine 2-epimerase (non-hydrolyzing) [Candidatus Acidoferrum sp.]|nr:UDP-N-acetylglucosamine 2-epimerase (non-hydrolyzing) [Candidatus Acidoferrum sp.]
MPRPAKPELKWVSVVGARPQFVKLAPVCRMIDAHNRQANAPHINHRIIHTGQHYDRELACVFFEQMQIPEPNYNLEVGSGSHGVQLARMLERLEPVLSAEHPDWVVVYGDTNSAAAAALLAARLKLPLAHVEAGCRSGDTEPEEQNRIVSDHLSNLLLAPSEDALENLRREGLSTENNPHKRRAVVTGDVMYDALLQNRGTAETYAERSLQHFGLSDRKYYVLTIHRAENTADPDRLREILSAVGSLDLPVLFPVHPRTRKFLDSIGLSLNGNIRPVAPLGYFEMIAMESHASAILTDSGGVQKEAFYLNVPCVTLRDTTEWPDTVAVGANCLAGRTAESIMAAVAERRPRHWSISAPYGDGRAAERIVSELLVSSRA